MPVGGNPLLLCSAPTGIGVELAHCGCCFRCVLAQILLQQYAILVDEECHDPRIAVFSWIGDEGESTGHLPIDHVVLRAPWRVTALPPQHMEVISMERHMRVWLCAISFFGCKCRQWSERAFRLTFRRLPIQTVL